MRKRKGVVILNLWLGIVGIIAYLIAGIPVLNNFIDATLPEVGDVTALALQSIHIVVIIGLLVFTFRRQSAEDVEFR